MYYAHTYIDIADFIMSIHTNSIVGNCNSAKKIIMVFIPQNAEVKKRHLTPEAGQYSHTHSQWFPQVYSREEFSVFKWLFVLIALFYMRWSGWDGMQT